MKNWLYVLSTLLVVTFCMKVEAAIVTICVCEGPKNIMIKSTPISGCYLVGEKDINAACNRLPFPLFGKAKINKALVAASYFRAAFYLFANSNNGINSSTDIMCFSDSIVNIDTVVISKRVTAFVKNLKINQPYKITAAGIRIKFVKAMTADGINYFCFRIRNKNKKPCEITNISLLHKKREISALLSVMPILYKRGLSILPPRKETTITFVVSAKQFMQEDEIIVVLKTKDNHEQILLYLPVTVLPDYVAPLKMRSIFLSNLSELIFPKGKEMHLPDSPPYP